MQNPKKLLFQILIFLSIILIAAYFYNLFSEDDILSDPILENLYEIPYQIVRKSDNSLDIPSKNIAIVIVLSEGKSRDYYKIAVDSVECYAKAHGYQFVLTNDDGWGCEYLKVHYFRRHCVLAKILPKYDAILHVDADIGVVNPIRKLQDYLDEKIDITFYDRHTSPEIAIGAYLARNTSYAANLIREFAEYEEKMPDSFHGTENGALHMFLAEKLFPQHHIELELCRKAWSNSKDYADVFAYTACIRALLGASTDLGKVRILRKGTGFVRDGWLTSGVWSPERDFMLHGFKMHWMTEMPSEEIVPVIRNNYRWYNPFLGDFDLERCGLGNTTWDQNPRLIATREAIEYELRKQEMKTALRKIEYLKGLDYLIKRKEIRKMLQPSQKSIFNFS